MKYFGCKSEYNNQRTQDLLKAYFQYLHSCSHVFLPDVYKNVANMPASRFWVSERRAAIVVASISRGDKLLYMRENKRQMYFEIYRRVQELRHRHPGQPITLLDRLSLSRPPASTSPPAVYGLLLSRQRNNTLPDYPTAGPI